MLAMITIVVRDVRPGVPAEDEVLGTIVVDGDRVLEDEGNHFPTVWARGTFTPGDSLEERLRGALPYSNGYITWDIFAS